MLQCRMQFAGVVLTAGIVLCGLAPGARAAGSEAGAGTRWAVLVGVGRYDDDSIPALRFSGADARALRQVLVDPARGGFPEANVLAMTDDATDPKLKPTRLNILSRLRAWADLAGPQDTLLFFFSGHGIAEKGRGYLLPTDARVGILSDSAVGTARIDEILGDSKAKCTLVLLDACHSAAGKDLAVMSTEFSQELFSDADGRVTMASCRENQQSFEWKEKGQGVYTYFVVQGLGGEADANRDGAVTVTELNAFAHARVTRWAAENGRKQEPRAEMRISGDVVLARAPGGTGTAPSTAAATPVVLPAKLQVTSRPAGARVLLDGNVQPKPTDCELVVESVTGKARKYQLVIEKAGYRSQGLELELAGGEVVPLDVALEKAAVPVATTGTTTSGTGTAVPAAGTTATAVVEPPEPSPAAGGPGPRPGWHKIKRLLDALKLLGAGPRLHWLTVGQKKTIARILLDYRGRQDLTPAEVEAVLARVRAVLRDDQLAELGRLLKSGQSQVEARPVKGRPRMGARPPFGKPPRQRVDGEPQRPWWDHPFYGELPKPRR